LEFGAFGIEFKIKMGSFALKIVIKFGNGVLQACWYFRGNVSFIDNGNLSNAVGVACNLGDS
jgi:hypothetical protein